MAGQAIVPDGRQVRAPAIRLQQRSTCPSRTGPTSATRPARALDGESRRAWTATGSPSRAFAERAGPAPFSELTSGLGSRDQPGRRLSWTSGGGPRRRPPDHGWTTITRGHRRPARLRAAGRARPPPAVTESSSPVGLRRRAARPGSPTSAVRQPPRCASSPPDSCRGALAWGPAVRCPSARAPPACGGRRPAVPRDALRRSATLASDAEVADEVWWSGTGRRWPDPGSAAQRSCSLRRATGRSPLTRTIYRRRARRGPARHMMSVDLPEPEGPVTGDDLAALDLEG